MLIEIPKEYKRTRGNGERLDAFLKINLTESDIRSLRSKMLLGHVETFNLTGSHREWFVVSHVYPEVLSDKTISELDAICSRTNLMYRIFDDSWYSDETKRIEFYNKLYHMNDEVIRRRWG